MPSAWFPHLSPAHVEAPQSSPRMPLPSPACATHRACRASTSARRRAQPRLGQSLPPLPLQDRDVSRMFVGLTVSIRPTLEGCSDSSASN
eukprot:CAMPEP_0170180412 /NCGR_PEP_ID=MMETSP0040_2-20121228/21912_1 /TAXON_ID=641309 /ORGANISM="Lotharella oceanica, Strain CCMP622" /LENGTH=89 /DNA_ID=CAMNT_0010425041 /DNA_START=277 /DNA_END=546 /DNA_ORIENTATION=-